TGMSSGIPLSVSVNLLTSPNVVSPSMSRTIRRLYFSRSIRSPKQVRGPTCADPRYKWVGLCEVEGPLAEPFRYNLAIFFFEFHTDGFSSEVSSCYES